MLLHWLAQLLITAAGLWLGSRILRGVTLTPAFTALGAALFLGLFSIILQDFHTYIVQNLPFYTWTPIYLVWDTLLLLLLSRFISGLTFQRWWWALLLALILTVVQTLGWILIPMPT